VPKRSVSTQNTRSGSGPLGKGPFLRSVRRRGGGDEGRFPFSVPAIRSLVALDLAAPVSFFVGENGSGKSTVLEAIAAAARLPAVGSDDVQADGTLAAQRELGDALQLVWSRRTKRGFFLRAEDFFGFTKRLAVMRADLQARLAEIELEYAERSAYAKGLASGPVRASLGALETRYGVDLDANSHGQSFLHLFRSRFVPGVRPVDPSHVACISRAVRGHPRKERMDADASGRPHELDGYLQSADTERAVARL